MVRGYFGLPGSGKSTFLAKKAFQTNRKGFDVFVNEDFPIAGCYLYKFSDLGRYEVKNGLVLMDEVSLDADNRDFKQFSKRSKTFFILHRHYYLDVVWCTQKYNGVDNKILNMTDQMYYIKRWPLGFSMATKIDSIIYIPTRRSLKLTAGDITQTHIKSGLLSILLAPFTGALEICWRRRFYRYFDSFKAPELPKIHFPYYTLDHQILYYGDEGYPSRFDDDEPDVKIRRSTGIDQ